MEVVPASPRPSSPSSGNECAKRVTQQNASDKNGYVSGNELDAYPVKHQTHLRIIVLYHIQGVPEEPSGPPSERFSWRSGAWPRRQKIAVVGAI